MGHDSEIEDLWYLCRDAHIAVVDGAAVALSVPSDEYYFLGPREFGDIRLHLAGISYRPEPGVEGIGEKPREILADLETKGILTRNPALGKKFQELRHFETSIEVPGPAIDRIPRIEVRHIFLIAESIIRAWFLIHMLGMSAAVRVAGRLRSELSGRPLPDIGLASNLVEIYHRVRPFFFASKDRCLFNSLALFLFLSRYGISPEWSFGIKLNPFSAHCWLEDESFLYNDQYCRTHDYAVIMRV